MGQISENEPTFTVHSLSLKLCSAWKSILNGQIEEKEADIYRSSNFFLQKEYIGKYFSNSSESKPTFTVRLPFFNENSP